MLKEKLSLLPDLPGCYLMKNKDNVIAIMGIIFFVVLAVFARFSTNDNVVNDNKDNDNDI